MANVSTSTVSYATRQQTGSIVFFANDGSVCVLWQDGTNQKFSYSASSAGTAWTAQTLVTGTNQYFNGKIRANDVIDVVTGGAGVNTPQYYPLTKVGATWVLGTPNIISSTPSGSLGIGNVGNYAGQDAQGRHWVVLGGTSTYLLRRILYSPANTPTNTAWTVGQGGAQTANVNSPAGDLVANWLVEIWWNGTAFQWDRADASGSSVGAFSANATIPGLTGSPNTNSYITFHAISPTQGLLVYTTTTNGVYAQLYTAATDTWGAAVQLSAGTSDIQPTIATDMAGNAWVVWCQWAAANNYALVSKSYFGGVWQGTPTTIIASGTNIRWPGAAYNPVLGNIGVVYTVGTISPWTVGWVTFGGKTVRNAAGRFKFSNPYKRGSGRIKYGLAGYQAAVLSDGAYGYYGLNITGPKMPDFTGSGRDGYAYGNVTYGQPTPLKRIPGSSSMLFDGATGYVSLPIEEALGNATAISVEAWFQLSNLTYENNPRIISADDTANHGYMMYVANGGTSVNFVVGNGTTSVTATMTTNLTAGRWYHAVGTYDGANVRMYVNGVVGATAPALTGNIGQGVFPTIGRNNHSTVDWFPGYIDDVSLYKSALSGATITNHLVQGMGLRDWDEFGRGNVSSGWGVPPSGTTWGITGAATLYNLTSGQGTITTVAGGTYATFRAATGISANNSIVADVKASATTAAYGVITCYTDVNNYYRLVITGSSGVLQLQKTVAGGGFFVGPTYTIPSFAVGTMYSLRLTYNAGVLYGKVWVAGTVEPDAYQVSAADASLTTGSQGIYWFPGSASSTVMTVDNIAQEDAALYIPVTRTYNAIGRLEVGVQATKNGLGRVIVGLRTIQNGVGRIGLGVRATRNAVGRLRFFPQVTRNATGRLEVGVRATRNGLGRLRAGVVATRNGIGRLRYFPQVVRNGLGRINYKGRTTRNAIGRLRYFPQITRNAVGRLRYFPQVTRNAAGRAIVRGQTIRNGLGRLRFGATAVTRNAVGRLKAVGQTTRNAVGRLGIRGQALRNAAARIFFNYAGEPFARANNASSWGTNAYDGTTWQAIVVAGSFTPSISSQRAFLASTANSTNIMTYSAGGWGPNGSVQVEMSQNVAQNSGGLVYRYTDANNYYRLVINGSNGVLQCQKISGGSGFFLGTTYTVPGYSLVNTYVMRFTCIGQLLLGKIWLTNTPEPSGYQVMAVDASQTGGRAGVYANSGTATSSLFAFDNFYITDYTSPMRNAIGRMNIIGRRTSNALGRIKVGLPVIRNALGRMYILGRSTRNGLGRLRVVLTATRNGLGRLRLGLGSVRNGLGRIRFVVLVAKNGVGRLRYKGQTTRNPVGRMIVRGRSTYNALARLRVGNRVIRNGLGRIKFVYTTLRNTAGRVIVSIRITRNALGRMLLVGQHKTNAVGRLRFGTVATQVTRNAMARMWTVATRVRNATGRLKLYARRTSNSMGRLRLALLSVRNGVGRLYFVTRHTFNATGRLRVVSVANTTLQNAVGRLRLGISTKRNAVGRLYLGLLSRRNGLGRLTFALRTRLNAAGRLRFFPQRIRNGVGRIRVSTIGVRNAIGRLKFFVGHTTILNALGRMRVVQLYTSKRNAVGRLFYAQLQKQNALGRLKFFGRRISNATGRIKVYGRRTSNALGRIKFFPQVTRNAKGRIVVSWLTKRRATGHLRFALLRVQNAVGRLGLRGRSTKNASGRVVLRGRATLNTLGRLVLRGKTTRRSRARLYVLGRRKSNALGRLWYVWTAHKHTVGRIKFYPQATRTSTGRLWVVQGTIDATFTLPDTYALMRLPENTATFATPDNTAQIELPDNMSEFMLPDNTATLEAS